MELAHINYITTIKISLTKTDHNTGEPKEQHIKSLV